jgi:hypothetical protein
MHEGCMHEGSLSNAVGLGHDSLGSVIGSASSTCVVISTIAES